MTETPQRNATPPAITPAPSNQAPALRKVSGADIVEAVKRDLETRMPQLEAVLPRHIEAARYVRIVLTALWQNPDLLNCTKDSILRASMRCAQDGLVPDGREAALVKFGSEATYMPMVYGIVKKLRQSGEIATITSRIVYTGEIAAGRFKFIITDGEERLTHEPMFSEDRGLPAYVYAAVKFKDGSVQYEVLTKGDVEKVRSISRAKNAGPWKDWWEEMARKTAIRRLSKLLPLSAEDRRLVENDDFTEFNREKDAARNSVLANAASQFGAPAIEDQTEDEVVTNTIDAGESVLAQEAADEAHPLTDMPDELLALANCVSVSAVERLEKEVGATIVGKGSQEQLVAWDEACAARIQQLMGKTNGKK